MDRLISEQKAIEAINDYWGEMETPTINGYINAIRTIPSADKTCEGCIFNTEFVHGCSACQQCSRFYSDMYTVRRDNLEQIEKKYSDIHESEDKE